MNGRCARHADSPEPVDKGGGTPGNRNAAGHGAPEGNENARTHGLFAKSLTGTGLAVYQAAESMRPEDIGRQTADFIVAKVAEACATDKDLEASQGPVVQALRALLVRQEITAPAFERLVDRLFSPDLAALGKFMGPLKGLLEVKARDGAIAAEDYARLMADVADAVAQAAEETIEDETVRAALLESVDARWARIQHQPPGRRAPQGAG